MLEFVVYKSKATSKMTELKLLNIIEVSMRLNRREGLTGFLHMRDGMFMQYLEGPAGPLQRKIATIAADRRHTDFQILAEGDLDERLFGDWDMGLLENRSASSTGGGASFFHAISPEEVLEAFVDHAGLAGHLSIAGMGKAA